MQAINCHPFIKQKEASRASIQAEIDFLKAIISVIWPIKEHRAGYLSNKKFAFKMQFAPELLRELD